MAKSITHIVISHGHNDHTRDLKFLHEKFDLSKVKLIAHPYCFLPKISEKEYIGAPYLAEEISQITAYTPSSTPCQISDNCVFLGEIPRVNSFEKTPQIGTTTIDGKKMTDYILDDSALVCKTQSGLFIVTGCSHGGICNVVEYAKKIFDTKKVSTIIGGFHLFDKDERLEKTIDYLAQISAKNIYPCHCVSLEAKCEMAKAFAIKEVGVGLSIEM